MDASDNQSPVFGCETHYVYSAHGLCDCVIWLQLLLDVLNFVDPWAWPILDRCKLSLGTLKN
jgi:hypothetical protein